MTQRNLTPIVRGLTEPILERELRLLEFLLKDPGLSSLRTRSPSHPAVKRYDTIRAFIDRRLRIQYPNEVDLVLEVGSLVLDGMAIHPGAAPEETLETIDDPDVLRQLRLRVLDPQQFSDQMVALSCWDLLRGNGVSAKLVEKDGLPDIAVPLIDRPYEWIEVKRIRIGSDPGRVRRVIKHANTQIKRADADGAGSVYLSIERQQQRVVFDDAIPNEVQAYINEVDRELGIGFSKSVHSVIVAWDDYLLLGGPSEPTTYFLRRHSVVMQHRAPRLISSLPAQAFELRRTVMLPIRWSRAREALARLAPIQVGNITVTEDFRKDCELTGSVRAVHAIEALQNPDEIARYELGDLAILLVTRRIATARHPYTLLLMVSVHDSDRFNILLGFRVYFEESEVARSSHPFEVFTAFLQRYGCPVIVGNYRGLFIPRAIVSASADSCAQIVRADIENGESISVKAWFKVLGTTPRVVEVTWAFAIFTERYIQDIKQCSR